MKTFVIVLLSVLLIGGMTGMAEALDLELHGGGYQSSVMETPATHFVNLGATLSHTTAKDITFYGHAMGDFTNERIADLVADGTHVEVGTILPVSENSNIRIYAFDNESAISIDNERIGFMYNLKVSLF